MAANPPGPDLSERPLGHTVERDMAASPAALYQAWTEGWECWFAEPGSLSVRAEAGGAFFF